MPHPHPTLTAPSPAADPPPIQHGGTRTARDIEKFGEAVRTFRQIRDDAETTARHADRALELLSRGHTLTEAFLVLHGKTG